MAKTADAPPGMDERSPEWHFDAYCDFVAKKLAVGEPSPHLKAIAAYTNGMPAARIAWMLGCQGSVYVQTPGYAIFESWSQERVVRNPAGLNKWLTDNWKGVITRTERRCVRTPEKLTRCLYGYASWLEQEYPRMQSIGRTAGDLPEGDRLYYDTVWASVNSVPFFGRYIAIRIIEGLRRFCEIPAMMYDIRTMDGWSPRKSMCYLYPDRQEQLLTESPSTNRYSQLLADELLMDAQVRVPEMTPYILAGTLCEYRQCFSNRHQYPGWTIDQELELHRKVDGYWGEEISGKFYAARRAAYPETVLGELQGWYGVRMSNARQLRDIGVNWSDLA